MDADCSRHERGALAALQTRHESHLNVALFWFEFTVFCWQDPLSTNDKAPVTARRFKSRAWTP